jgi:hypothetical protein
VAHYCCKTLTVFKAHELTEINFIPACAQPLLASKIEKYLKYEMLVKTRQVEF